MFGGATNIPTAASVDGNEVSASAVGSHAGSGRVTITWAIEKAPVIEKAPAFTG